MIHLLQRQRKYVKLLILNINENYYKSMGLKTKITKAKRIQFTDTRINYMHSLIV